MDATEQPADEEPHDGYVEDGGHGGRSVFGTIAMVAVSAGAFVLVFILLPAFGYSSSLLTVITAVGLMLVLHLRFMNHGGKH
jgi:hypothetical protein